MPDGEIDIAAFSSLSDAKESGGPVTVYGKGDLLVKTVLDFFVDEDIKFHGISSKFPDPEDVFLSLTGRRIRVSGSETRKRIIPSI